MLTTTPQGAGSVEWKEPNMKRIGRYLITAVGLMTLGGAPSLFAGERYHDRREFRRYERHRERDHFYRYRYDRRDWR